MVHIECLIVGQLQTNCYLLSGSHTKATAIIDPGDDSDYIINRITDLGLSPKMIIATHAHFDHVLAAGILQHTLHIPFMMHVSDQFLLHLMQKSARYYLKREIVEMPPTVDQALSSTSSIKLGNYDFTVIETPGHTPGSVCIYNAHENILFCGDTLFADGGVGRTDFKYSSPHQLSESLEKILALPSQTTIYPGHGKHSTITIEERNLSRFRSD